MYQSKNTTCTQHDLPETIATQKITTIITTEKTNNSKQNNN